MGIGSAANFASDYIAVVDIDFYAYLRDPANGATESALVMTGAFWDGASLNWLLFEGCKFRFFTTNIDVNPIATQTDNPLHTVQNLYVRRNIIVDAYSSGAANAGEGVLISGATNFVMDENLFDHNYSDTVTGAGPNVFRHNFYIGGFVPDGTSITPNTGTLAFANAKGNISTNDPSGSHFRSGGNITDNLFAYNPYQFDIGAPGVGSVNTVANNVFLSSINNAMASGYGPITMDNGSIYQNDNYAIGTISFQNNVIAHSVGLAAAQGIGITVGFNGVTVTNNIICGWTTGAPIVDGNGANSGNTISPNYTKSADCNAGGWANQPPGLVDGTRTIETYDSAILGGPGTFAHFIGLARQQSKGNWNPALMADAVNNYIRAGFGISSGTTSTSSTATSTLPYLPSRSTHQ